MKGKLTTYELNFLKTTQEGKKETQKYGVVFLVAMNRGENL